MRLRRWLLFPSGGGLGGLGGMVVVVDGAVDRIAVIAIVEGEGREGTVEGTEDGTEGTVGGTVGMEEGREGTVEGREVTAKTDPETHPLNDLPSVSAMADIRYTSPRSRPAGCSV